ncbi:hypothetical protein [Pseudomonas fulva]|uniref:hypothetical protein n=1 Tax=Pseudomonas fulva TaxID=47880 RepID=UPI0018AA22DF|nr:hypothetical protein [Pseudomonas fulva]MBF8694943.1 hypothetical protein [Pseudomonas fulva]
MTFVAINTTNPYDASNLTPYATEEQADARAREILQQFPAVKVVIAQVLKEYHATVTVTVQEPAAVEPEPDDQFAQ